MSDKDQNELYILKGLLKHVDFVSKFIDKLKHDYFSSEVSPVILVIKKYFLKYQKLATIELICNNFLEQACNGDSSKKEKAITAIEDALAISFDQKEYEEHYDWLTSMTKDWILKKSVETALMNAVDLYQRGDIKTAISKIIEASHINFDDDVGLEYIADLDKRIEQLKEKKLIIPTGIKSLDDAIGGGWRPNSLIVIGAGTNVGKTLILGAITAHLIQLGLNGLYVTLEINDYMLANRIDANIADVKMCDLPNNPDRLKEIITNKVESSKRNGNEIGRLIIKEYPPATISAQNILSAIRDFELKRGGFKPDFICVDYLGLMIPNAKSFSDNTYGKLKTVSEELRAIGCKLKVPIFSAVQINREGYKQEKIGLQNTSDSMGIPMTADLMIMVSRTEELEQAGAMYWEIAKNRWAKNGEGLRIKVDYDHMRLMDAADFTAKDEQTEEAKQMCKQLSSSGPQVSPPSANNLPFKKKPIV